MKHPSRIKYNEDAFAINIVQFNLIIPDTNNYSKM